MRTLEPIPPKAWDEIKKEATEVLKSALSARKIVDIEGPKGMDHPAVPLGRLETPDVDQEHDLRYGIHSIMPMVELKSLFTLNIHEIETIARGARDVNLDPVQKAANRLAIAEDEIVYQGFEKAGITGLANSSKYNKIKWPEKITGIPKAVTESVLMLKQHNIDGPYSLLLESEKWDELYRMNGSYPLIEQIREIVDGHIVLNKNTKDSLLVSERGNDFILTLGQDISMGYEYQEQEDLRLYLLESFSFMVVEPRAVALYE